MSRPLRVMKGEDSPVPTVIQAGKPQAVRVALLALYAGTGGVRGAQRH